MTKSLSYPRRLELTSLKLLLIEGHLIYFDFGLFPWVTDVYNNQIFSKRCTFLFSCICQSIINYWSFSLSTYALQSLIQELWMHVVAGTRTLLTSLHNFLGALRWPVDLAIDSTILEGCLCFS